MDERDPCKRATIKFPRAIAKRTLQSLLGCMARELETPVIYNIDKRYEHMPLAHQPVIVSIEVRGQVMPTSKMIEMGGALGFFVGTRLDRKTEFTKIDALRFDVTPGYSLKEHGEGTIYIWDKTREAIRGYFHRII